MKSLLILIITIILLSLNSYAGGASHELGIGSYILTENDNFKTDFGFNIHYDFRPNNYLVLRTSISGLISKAGIGTRDTYSNAFYLNRGTISEKPILKDKFLILSLEKSILYRINKGTFEPYAGIGIGIYSTKLADVYYFFSKSSKYTFGLNLCGGIKYPMTGKWSSYLEVKQIFFNYTADDNNIRYSDTSVSDGYNVTGSTFFPDRVINMNRFVINAGISFRL